MLLFLVIILLILIYFSAFTNVPLLITVGSTTKKPMAVNNKIEIRDVINVTLTLDHRYIDGARAAPVYKKFVEFLNNPEKAAITVEGN